MKTDESRLEGHSCHNADSNSSSGKVCTMADLFGCTRGFIY